MESALQVTEKVMEFIEGHLKEKITLEGISESVNISKYHLHRLFKAITGKRLMDYVRGRKLAMSIQDLSETDLRIIDIA